ncbi:MAG: epoxyqueuosine reductase QueH [Clostridia bacterium]|nr:epoxyqueuosine reductase QueH [Clostridia bacterium]
MVQFTLPKNFKNGAKLLLHSCCAPCSTAGIEALKDYFDITVFYYNPNITDEQEYQKRKAEQIKLLKILSIPFIEGDYNVKDFFDGAKDLANEKEGGKRCEFCIKLRLEKTAEYANNFGFDYFCSTLSVSPHKNSQYINSVGQAITLENTKYLVNNFKKNNGFLRSIQLSNQHNLYRQNYCGCIYSKRQAEDT